MEDEQVYKLLLLGEQAVGKSSLLNRYVDDVFEVNIMGTAGLDLKKKTLNINGDSVKVLIFDSAGHERFRSIAKNQFSKADGIVIVYDITDKKTFEAVNMWFNLSNKEMTKENECLFIGNKIDLEEQREVTFNEGNELAKKYNVAFIETSAKESLNVKEAFLKVINTLYYKEVGNNKGKENKRGKNKSGGCCYAAS
jgi:small GTP-binding protein